jgi:hypothetical protein
VWRFYYKPLKFFFVMKKEKISDFEEIYIKKSLFVLSL